jgi:hypothetical protein
MSKVYIEGIHTGYHASGEMGVVDCTSIEVGGKKKKNYRVVSRMQYCRGYIGEYLLALKIIDQGVYPEWRQPATDFKG